MSCPNFTWTTNRWNTWNESELGPMPRACSYCGGVNMDDAIVLIQLHGWKIEFTTKRYKFYLNHKHHSGVPPVKVYVDHMSPKHIREFNDCITKQVGDKHV